MLMSSSGCIPGGAVPRCHRRKKAAAIRRVIAMPKYRPSDRVLGCFCGCGAGTLSTESSAISSYSTIIKVLQQPHSKSQRCDNGSNQQDENTQCKVYGRKAAQAAASHHIFCSVTS